MRRGQVHVHGIAEYRSTGTSRKAWPMSDKTDAIINSLAAVLVLFTAMLDPRISVGLAVAFLLGLAIYKFGRKGKP